MNSVTRTVFLTELRQLVRDRRALFAAVILPALLYPLIFWSSKEVERTAKEVMEAREVQLAVDFDQANEEVVEQARTLLSQETPIQIFDLDASELRTFERSQSKDLIGDNDVDGGFTTLRSPTFDLTGARSAQVSYWRWYSNNKGLSPHADVFRAQISNDDGATWTTVETVGPSGAEASGEWLEGGFLMDAVVPLTSTMRVQFIAEDKASQGSLIEAAIDDFKVTALSQGAPGASPQGKSSAVTLDDETLLYSYDFEATDDQGWEGHLAGDTATTGHWVRGDPIGTDAQPEKGHTPGEGNTGCWFTGQGPPAPMDPGRATARRRADYDTLLTAGEDALITAEQDAKVASRTVFRIYYNVKDDGSSEAAGRARRALGELEQRLTHARREQLLSVDPARGLDLEAVDIARPGDSSGATLGRWLPLLAVMVLLSGGSYAALAVFAGEREAGTLETLLVQPVPAQQIALGKFLAVLSAGSLTLLMNLGSLIACGVAGMGNIPGFEDGANAPGLARYALGIIYLPGGLLLCAVLCLVCGKARTFREGQQTLLPVLLFAVLPTGLVMQPELQTSLLLAALPFAGAALCVRDAMAGDFELLPVAVMWISHAGYSWLVLAKLGVLLDAERVLSAESSKANNSMRGTSSRHGLRWAFVSVLLMYVLGTRLQQWNLEWGLGLTLWVLVVGLAVCTALRAPRNSTGLGAELGLRPPRLAHLLGALLCVPAAAWAMLEFMAWQMNVLPMPQSAMEGSAGLEVLATWSTGLLVFMIAISPGICEELLFRGAILSSLRRDLTPTRAVLWQAFFFALMHLSVYRFFPTFLLGVGLGALTLRARSLWPAVLFHGSYNALQVLTQGEPARLGWAQWEYWTWLPWLALLGLPILLAVRHEEAPCEPG